MKTKRKATLPGPPKVPCFLEVFCYIKPTKKHSFGCLRRAEQRWPKRPDMNQAWRVFSNVKTDFVPLQSKKSLQSFTSNAPRLIASPFPSKKSCFFTENYHPGQCHPNWPPKNLPRPKRPNRFPPKNVFFRATKGTSTTFSMVCTWSNGVSITKTQPQFFRWRPKKRKNTREKWMTQPKQRATYLLNGLPKSPKRTNNLTPQNAKLPKTPLRNFFYKSTGTFVSTKTPKKQPKQKKLPNHLSPLEKPPPIPPS